MIRYTTLAIISMMVVSCSPVQQPKEGTDAKPKNIIFMIGDGMGIAQITAGLYRNNNQLNLERCTHTGLIKTHSASALITDSAAGATAFSIGKKTYNGAIGVDEDTISRTTILEKAADSGLKTGLVSTSSITHATPASFYAHVPFRKMEEEIATFFLNKKVNHFAGGGIKFFYNRSDERDLVAEMMTAGFVLDTIWENYKNTTSDYSGFLGAENGMEQYRQDRGEFLTEATKMMIQKLNNENGFFLMVEGSQIDWGGHANDAEYIITEMIDFDHAVGAALDFAEQDGETLVVITADHETGGFSITGGNQDSLQTAFTTGYHTPILINVFAFGPGSSEFSGIYDNITIFDKFNTLTGK